MDLLKKMPNGVLQACATFLHNFGHHFGHYHHYHQYNFEYVHHHLIRSPPHHEEHVFKAGSPFHRPSESSLHPSTGLPGQKNEKI